MSIAEKFVPFEEEAVFFVSSKLGSVEISTVILDDWDGIRLIYETDDVLNCTNRCESCKTYVAFGEDQNPAKHDLRTTLVKSSVHHTDITRNRMLNCKTKSGYMSSFSEWLVKRCVTTSDFCDELVLIRDFRVVYSKTCNSDTETRILENEMKKTILQSAMHQMEGAKREIFEEIVAKIFGKLT